jgi:hypothetical protein
MSETATFECKEQLEFAFADNISCRLYEPLDSLLLTPFALKAARSTGALTVSELTTAIDTVDHLGMGRGYREEIRRKIAEFIKEAPSPDGIDWGSLLRCVLASFEQSEKAAISLFFGISSLFPPPSQGVKEAESLLLRRGFAYISEILEKKGEVRLKTETLLRRICVRSLLPWMHSHGNIVHETELYLYLQRQSGLDFEVFEGVSYFLRTLLRRECPYGVALFPITSRLFAANKDAQKWGIRVLFEANEFVKEQGDIRSVSSILSRRLLRCWEYCSQQLIQQVLGWHYLDVSLN